MRFILLFLLCLSALEVSAQTVWQKQNADTKASFRGLSVVNKDVVWASGTGGTVVKTTDGGKVWRVFTVKGAEKLDFRDIEAFDEKTAYVLSIGEGENSRIYKTSDGGETWQMQFQNSNPQAFFDAFGFFDRTHGIAMSDPVGGKYLLLETDDGTNWKILENVEMPETIAGEAAFAASGTCLIVNGKNDVFIVSGGNNARVFRSENRGRTWTAAAPDFVKGSAGSGIFSIAMRDAKNGVIVGGNYEKPLEITQNLAFTRDGGKTFQNVEGLKGYRSGAAFIDRKKIIAVGASGSDISFNGGKTWQNLDRAEYNAVRSKGEKSTWAVGAKGLIAKLKIR